MRKSKLGKKLLVSALTFAMVLSMCPVSPVKAADEVAGDDVVVEETTEAVVEDTEDVSVEDILSDDIVDETVEEAMQAGQEAADAAMAELEEEGLLEEEDIVPDLAPVTVLSETEYDEVTCIEISAKDQEMIDDYYEPIEDQVTLDATLFSWDSYDSVEMYNKLSSKEKTLYNKMETACKNLLNNKTGSARTVSTGGRSYYATSGSTFSTKDISKSRFAEIFTIFIYENPQYYFLNNSYFYSVSGTTVTVSPCVYPDFKSGSARYSASSALDTMYKHFVTDIKGYTNTSEKIIRAHDIVVYYCRYNKNTFDQSVYSVFAPICMGPDKDCAPTVCAGYAKSFMLLCNGCGIKCMTVVSKTHGWNKVKLGDYWYNVDCTWDDTEAPFSYTLTSDARIKDTDHTMTSLMAKYAPKSPKDWNSGAFQIKPSSKYVTVGTTVAMPLNYYGSKHPDVSWFTTNSSIATVDAYGNVKGISDGKVTIIAQVKSPVYPSSFYYYSYVDLTVRTAVKTTLHYGYNVDGVEKTASHTVYTMGKYNLPTPTRSGYTFIGWYHNSYDANANFVPRVFYSNSYYVYRTDVPSDMYALWLKTPTVTQVYSKNSSGKYVNAMKITWGKYAPATGYKIYRKKSAESDSTFKCIKTITSNATTSYTDYTSLTNGTKYTYEVIPTFDGIQTIEAFKRNSVSMVRLSRVTNSKLTTKSSNHSITVTHTKNSKATGYQITYSTDKNFKKDVHTLCKKGTSNTTITKTKLKKGKRYYVKVRAYKTVSGKNQYSAYSNVKSIVCK